MGVTEQTVWLLNDARQVIAGIVEYESVVTVDRFFDHSSWSGKFDARYFDDLEAATFALVGAGSVAEDPGSEIFLVERVNRVTAESDTGPVDYVEASGRSATAMLHARTVVGTMAWDGARPGGVIQDIMATFTGSRDIPGFEYGFDAMAGDDLDLQHSWGDAGALAREVCSAQNLGMRARLGAVAPTFYREWADNFNRADGSLGSDWSVLSGTIAIVGNEVKCSNVAGGEAKYLRAGVMSQQTVRVWRNIGLAYAGPAARMQDASNYYYAMIHGVAPTLRLYKRVNGTDTLIGSTAAPTGTKYSLTLKCEGSNLFVFVDDAANPLISITDTTFASGHAGIWLDLSNTYVDDFSVTSSDVPGGTDPETIYLDTYAITDPGIYLGKLYGNALNAHFERNDAPWANYAIVLGEGEGSLRRRVDVDQTGSDFRRELYVDARDLQRTVDGTTMTTAQYDALLAQRGRAALANSRRLEFTEGDTGVPIVVGQIVHYDDDERSGDLLATEVTTTREGANISYSVLLGEPPKSVRRALGGATSSSSAGGTIIGASSSDDTGWQEGLTAATGWSFPAGSYNLWRRIGRIVYIKFTVQRTGTAITVPTDGNIANTDVVQVPAEIVPSVTQGIGAGAGGPLANFNIVNDAMIELSAVAPGTSLATNAQVSCSGSYLI